MDWLDDGTEFFNKTDSTYNVTSRGVRVTIVTVGKQELVHITNVFVTLFIRHAGRVRHVIVSSMASPYFVTLQNWLRLFSSQTFSPINTPTFLKPNHSSRLPAYEDRTECSETSVYKLQTSGNYPEESMQHSEQGESLK
jgi:hypothetical protein